MSWGDLTHWRVIVPAFKLGRWMCILCCQFVDAQKGGQLDMDAYGLIGRDAKIQFSCGRQMWMAITFTPSKS